VEGPAVLANQPFVTPSIRVTNLAKCNRLPIVIPTGAPKERRGGTCGVPCGPLHSRLSDPSLSVSLCRNNTASQ
jgi:hypothetical protein